MIEHPPLPRYSELSVTLGSDMRWVLDKPLQVEQQEGVIRTIPPGLITDFASFPVGIRCIVQNNGRAARPSVVHDDDWRRRVLSRKASDYLWWEGLVAENAFTEEVRNALYAGLRAFGWLVWRQ